MCIRSISALLAVFVSLTFVSALDGSAQTSNYTTRREPFWPESASDLFERGLTAAKSGEFRNAVRFFTKAHDADPANLNVVLNLGLAESKMRGWEVSALESFATLLTADPK